MSGFSSDLASLFFKTEPSDVANLAQWLTWTSQESPSSFTCCRHGNQPKWAWNPFLKKWRKNTKKYLFAVDSVTAPILEGIAPEFCRDDDGVSVALDPLLLLLLDERRIGTFATVGPASAVPALGQSDGTKWIICEQSEIEWNSTEMSGPWRTRRLGAGRNTNGRPWQKKKKSLERTDWWTSSDVVACSSPSPLGFIYTVQTPLILCSFLIDIQSAILTRKVLGDTSSAWHEFSTFRPAPCGWWLILNQRLATVYMVYLVASLRLGRWFNFLWGLIENQLSIDNFGIRTWRGIKSSNFTWLDWKIDGICTYCGDWHLNLQFPPKHVRTSLKKKRKRRFF